LFYWFYSVFSDCEHLNDTLIRRFPLPKSWSETNWILLSAKLRSDQKLASATKTITIKQGHVIQYEEMKAFSTKPTIDEIDRVLAKHFILNYDIKYRLGRDAGEGEGDTDA